MRALTLRPHWAHAVAHMGKRIENRSRPIPKALVGCRVAIHAGATLPRLWLDDLIESSPKPVTPIGADEIVTRHIVATAVLNWWEWPAGDTVCDTPPWGFIDSIFWWHLAEVRTLASPIPMQRGQLGLWHLPEDISKQLENQ
jgi:hypothetical protein